MNSECKDFTAIMEVFKGTHRKRKHFWVNDLYLFSTVSSTVCQDDWWYKPVAASWQISDFDICLML